MGARNAELYSINVKCEYICILYVCMMYVLKVCHIVVLGSGAVMSMSQRNLNTIYIHEGNLHI